MEFTDVLKGRRSVRDYTDERPTKEIINRILDAANYSPNAGNRNGTQIVVCEDSQINECIGKCHSAIIRGFNAGNRELPDEETIEKNGCAFYNAPVVIMLFAPRNFYFSEADSYIMAQNLCLAAYEQGVASCIVGEVMDSFATERGQKIKERLAIPADYKPYAYVLLGYSKDTKATYKERHYPDVIYVGE